MTVFGSNDDAAVLKDMEKPKPEDKIKKANKRVNVEVALKRADDHVQMRATFIVIPASVTNPPVMCCVILPPRMPEDTRNVRIIASAARTESIINVTRIIV